MLKNLSDYSVLEKFIEDFGADSYTIPAYIIFKIGYTDKEGGYITNHVKVSLNAVYKNDKMFKVVLEDNDSCYGSNAMVGVIRSFIENNEDEIFKEARLYYKRLLNNIKKVGNRINGIFVHISSMSISFKKGQTWVLKRFNNLEDLYDYLVRREKNQ